MIDFHRANCALLLLLCLCLFPTSTTAQINDGAPCGVVEAIAYPVDNLYEETIARGRDDFARYRERYRGIHVGLDVAFNRYGDPVYAAARGRVTYSNIEGWDINKGVVIVEHYFPDGAIYYSLYGHVEETESVSLPPVGLCVERGDIIGAVGDPEQGLPHLHYEIRNFMPGDGGPGYIDGNPLDAGWYHPLEFTFTWQVRLQPGFVAAQTFTTAPGIPPVTLSTGATLLASANSLRVVNAAGDIIWQVTTDGDVRGTAALPDGRVAAHTANGQVMVLENGRYLALWRVDDLDVQLPVVMLENGETTYFVFAAENGSLHAYDASGAQMWMLPGPGAGARSQQLVVSEDGTTLAHSTRADGNSVFRIVDAGGAVIYTATTARPAVFTPALNGWRILSAGDLLHVDTAGTVASIAQAVTPSPGRWAQMAVDRTGATYVYLGDSGRTLLAITPDGRVRWREGLPFGVDAAPLLVTDSGCLLYTLDSAGTFSVYDAGTGARVTDRTLYTGSVQNRQPQARTLAVSPRNMVTVNPGFLTLYTFDGTALGAGVLDGCLLG